MLIIYSGGMDSTVLLNEYKNDIKLAVSFNYGSKHNSKEIAFAKKNCKKLKIKHIVIDLPFINKYFASDLLKSGGEIPDGHYEDEMMKKTVVPFRNGIMLSIAAGLAESIGAKKILIANHAGDHAIYPDCRSTFIHEMSNAIAYGTETNINILAPYTNITKRDIALRGHKNGVDFSNTWSCYKGTEKHCGTCGTCNERKEALEGFDPTEYLA
mgnify:CR=1 FL=1